VYATTVLLRSELEFIRAAMEAPLEQRVLIQVRNAPPREVYFQALSLQYKAERLCNQSMMPILGTPVSLSTGPRDDLKPADILLVVNQAYDYIRCVMWDLQITDESAGIPPRDSAKTRADVIRSVMQASRQVNRLLERALGPGEVLPIVELANAYTTTLLDKFAPVWRSSVPSEPRYIKGRRPVDVYQELVSCYQSIQRMAGGSGLVVLDFDPELSTEVERGDLFDLAALVLSELRYFGTFAGVDIRLKFEPERGKVQSDVYQQAQLLIANLQHLEKLVDAFPGWRTLTRE